jgi:molybdenum cofactor cytidylyltransferase
MLRLCGVILAAGASSRMGTDKALLPWPPNANNRTETFLSSAIQAFSSFNDLVIVVGGKNAATITPVVDANGAFLVGNPEPEKGQFSSLQFGLREVLHQGCDGAMITLVDRPPVQPSTLEILRSEFEDALSRSKWAVVPQYRDNRGHPIVVGRKMIEAFLKAPSTATARSIQLQHREHIEYIPIDDAFVAMNVDTPLDYANLTSLK